jgi:hypothetical protein
MPCRTHERSTSQTVMVLPLASIVFTLGVWAWILTRPEGTFHDQGGLAITLLYFPSTFAAWLLCGLISVALRRRRPEGEAEADVARFGKLRRRVYGLIALGLLLSIGTLFIE